MPPRYSNSEEVSTQVWKLREGIYRDRQRGGDEMGRRERERESEKDVWRFSHADKHLGCVMSVYWTCFWTFLHVLLVNIVICSIAPDTKNIINWSWDINMFRYCQFFFLKYHYQFIPPTIMFASSGCSKTLVAVDIVILNLDILVGVEWHFTAVCIYW